MFDFTEELLVLLLCTASCLTERLAPTLAEALVLFLSERDTVFPRDGFTAELRELPLSLLIVADFREVSFLVETADLVADERLSTAEPLFTRAL